MAVDAGLFGVEAAAAGPGAEGFNGLGCDPYGSTSFTSYTSANLPLRCGLYRSRVLGFAVHEECSLQRFLNHFD